MDVPFFILTQDQEQQMRAGASLEDMTLDREQERVMRQSLCFWIDRTTEEIEKEYKEKFETWKKDFIKNQDKQKEFSF